MLLGGTPRDSRVARVSLIVPDGPRDDADVVSGTFVAAVVADHPDEFQLLGYGHDGSLLDFQREGTTHDKYWSDFGHSLRATRE